MSIQAFKNDNISLKRIIKEKQIEIEITQKKIQELYTKNVQLENLLNKKENEISLLKQNLNSPSIPYAPSAPPLNSLTSETNDFPISYPELYLQENSKNKLLQSQQELEEELEKELYKKKDEIETQIVNELATKLIIEGCKKEIMLSDLDNKTILKLARIIKDDWILISNTFQSDKRFNTPDMIVKAELGQNVSNLQKSEWLIKICIKNEWPLEIFINYIRYSKTLLYDEIEELLSIYINTNK